MGNAKVKAAARATDDVQDMIGKAEALLSRRRAVNALGVYMAPEDVDLAISRALGFLRSAQDALTIARREWPTEADQSDC